MIGLPDLSLFPNIEEITLSGCESLEQVYSSSFLHKLNWLCLDGCISLKSLSVGSNILSSSNGLVALRGCRNLETILITGTTDVVQSYRCFNSYGYFDFKSISVFNDETRIWSTPDGGYVIGYMGEDLNMLPRISELCWLDLSKCESLASIPAELINLKFLTRLSLSGCFMLEELPEIEDTMHNLKVLNLDYTAITELPSSLHHLVGLEELSLQSCRKLKAIPSSIGNLSKLLKLDLAYCESLETFPSSIFKLKLTELDFSGCPMLRSFPEIPSNIGRFSSLTYISLQGSNIVNLPESIVHLSSLESLNLSDCKRLECIPKLPPNLNQFLAFDSPSIKRMMSNSWFKLMSDSNDGIYEFHLTNSEELDASSWSFMVNKTWIKITDDAYLFVLFCFPGSRVPDWFLHRCQGHSITVKYNDEYVCSENRLIGFALCVVFGSEEMDETRTRRSSITYKLSFIADGKPFVFQDNLNWKREGRFIIRDHTFLWKYQLDRASIGNNLIHAQSFTFEILGDVWPFDYQSNVNVKKCGIRPLYIPKNRMRAIFELDD